MNRTCSININRPNKEIYSGHIKLGGQDPSGNHIGVTNYNLTWNGKPYFVVSGEFHYSRYPRELWEEEILKIKAGGVNVLATYVFWAFHEERQGVFEWEGEKSLRYFIALCSKHDLKVILRIGPFDHGEWRNGGLPDWLYGQPLEVRSNHPLYLHYVRRLYTQIGQQVRGLMFKDGGPIIGVQIENEYMHAGAPWEVIDLYQVPEYASGSREGAEHLRVLKAMAVEAGLDAPIYTITGWGGAPIIEDESLPVYGEYAYPVWIDEPFPSSLYTFFDSHAHPTAEPNHKLPEYYPVACAEMQGGIQIRYNNRPVVPPESLEALGLVRIGSGCNWVGYYMYHGGTNPIGQHGFTNERFHPRRSYDFQAPIGEYGAIRDSYRYLKILHLFLHSYGEALCPMGTILPEGAEAIKPEDVDQVRFCVRVRDNAGFLFVNNFQDHVETRDLKNVHFNINTTEGILRIPDRGSLTVRRNAAFILPINQRLGDAWLSYATLQPLTVLRYDDRIHYFYFVPEGLEPEFCFHSDTIRHVSGALSQTSEGEKTYLKPPIGREFIMDIETASGQKVKITSLRRFEAEHIWQAEAWGAERIIYSEADLLFTNSHVEAQVTGDTEIDMMVWPAVNTALASKDVLEQTSTDNCTRLHVSVPKIQVEFEVEAINDRKHLLRLFVNDSIDDLSELFLNIDYEGDTGMAFIDGELVADNFNNGQLWSIGLKRFLPAILEKGLVLVFHPARKGSVKNVSSQIAGRVAFEGEEILTIRSMTLVPKYRTRIKVAET